MSDSWNDSAAVIKSNVLGTVGALNYCRIHGARLVFASSYLYGQPAAVPIPESARLLVNNPYALSKKLAEDTCGFYSERSGVVVAILRLFNVYGPGQSDRFLIPFIVRQVNEGVVVRVKDLEPRRDYVHVDDVVRAMMTAATCRQQLAVFNIGSGISHSVEEVIKMVQQLKGSRLPVESVGERRQGEIMNTVADITAARRQLGWMPRCSLVEGLRQMVTADEVGSHDVR